MMSRFDPDLPHPDDEAERDSLDEAWRFHDDHAQGSLQTRSPAMTHLDPRALEAAVKAQGEALRRLKRVLFGALNAEQSVAFSDVWGKTGDVQLAAAALAALPQAEPVAWIDRRLLKSMHGPSVAALSATVYSSKIDDNHVGLFASPTPAVSREVTEEMVERAIQAADSDFYAAAKESGPLIYHRAADSMRRALTAALSQPHSEK